MTKQKRHKRKLKSKRFTKKRGKTIVAGSKKSSSKIKLLAKLERIHFTQPSYFYMD